MGSEDRGANIAKDKKIDGLPACLRARVCRTRQGLASYRIPVSRSLASSLAVTRIARVSQGQGSLGCSRSTHRCFAPLGVTRVVQAMHVVAWRGTAHEVHSVAAAFIATRLVLARWWILCPGRRIAGRRQD